MTEIVIWAQSVCHSTMALYREVKRLPGIRVTVVLRQNKCGEQARRLRELQGQGDFSDVIDSVWDGDFERGRRYVQLAKETIAEHWKP